MNNSKILEFAKFYVSKGFSVIPLQSRDKIPALKSWKEYQKRYPTEDELQQWFGGNSENNIAIVTGAISKLAVLDFDNPEALAHFDENDLETPTVITNKGIHAYYLMPEGLRNFQNRDDLPGIDLRAEGGYVVAPPSIHPSGHQYVWEEGYGLDDLPLREFPQQILIKHPTEKTPLKELYQGVSEGQRNNAITRLIGSFVSDDLSYEECLEGALFVNSRNNPPLPNDEIERTVKSIYEKHHRELSYCPPIYSTDNKDNQLGDTLDLSKALRSGRELQALNIKIEWVVQDLIPLESITLLSAKGGTGKTIVSFQIGDAITKGLSIFCLETMKRPVIYIDFENPLPVVVDYVNRVGATDILFWHLSNEISPLRLDSNWWHLYKQLPEGAVLIFDTLRASQSKNENDSEQMSFIMMRLKELREKGFTIILLHHTSKSDERNYKGSTSIFDLSDHVLSFYRVRKGSSEGMDDETEDCLYKLGTKDKTRYTPFHTFLEFDKSRRFFIPAQDPDIDYLKAIHEMLTEKGDLNQTQIFEWAKSELDIKSKGRLVNLLKKGTGEYWKRFQQEEGGRAVYYRALSDCPPIYSTDNRTEPSELPEGQETSAEFTEIYEQIQDVFERCHRN